MSLSLASTYQQRAEKPGPTPKASLATEAQCSVFPRHLTLIIPCSPCRLCDIGLIFFIEKRVRALIGWFLLYLIIFGIIESQPTLTKKFKIKAAADLVSPEGPLSWFTDDIFPWMSHSGRGCNMPSSPL